MHRYKRIVFVLHISNLNQRKTTVLSRWGLPVLFCKKYYSYTFNIYWWPLFYFVCQVTDYKQILSIYIYIYECMRMFVPLSCTIVWVLCMSVWMHVLHVYMSIYVCDLRFPPSVLVYIKAMWKDIMIFHMNLNLP